MQAADEDLALLIAIRYGRRTRCRRDVGEAVERKEEEEVRDRIAGGGAIMAQKAAGDCFCTLYFELDSMACAIVYRRGVVGGVSRCVVVEDGCYGCYY